ncbi:hypothetical protein ACFPJ1_09850 [Kribbella qitaiheensis]|uniref:hypothetical protein n=1 Tax=Kribbella qitaiheensis TaxID=1544730 RepID=UPI003606E2D7
MWMVQDFAAGLIDGVELGPGIDHGVQITEIICAIEDSINTGRTVDLSDTSGDFMVVWSTIKERSSKSGRLRDVGAEGPDGFWSWWRC